MQTRNVVAGLAGLLMAPCLSRGQIIDPLRITKPAPSEVFEVASVRPSNGGQIVALKGGPGTRDPTRVSAKGVTLPNFLMAAYDVLGDQISGPASITTDRYDLQANIPAGATNQQYRLMMQNLLAERFHLTLRRETKDFPVYTLVLAKGGPKLKESAGDTKNPDHGADRSVTTDGVVRFTAVNESLQEFAAYLKLPLGFIDGHVMTAHIEDKTGLTGRYDFTLEYDWVLASPNAPGATPEAALPSLQSALERQLGIKLEHRKAPLDVLIVEHYDRVWTCPHF